MHSGNGLMLRKFIEDRSGNYGMMLAVVTLPLLSAVGLAVDFSLMSRAQQQLQRIADGAALAVAASGERDPDKMRAIGDRYVAANALVPNTDTIVVSSFVPSDGSIEIGLSGKMRPIFMGLANFDELEVGASATAVRGINGSVEVALVLDNTESMNYDDKIGTLKTAASKLTAELFKNKDADVRVALVPYAEQINVGTANRKASWISVPEDYTKTVTKTTDGYWHQPMKNTNVCKTWQEAGSRQVEKDGVWVTETWPRRCTAYERVPNGDPKWIEPKTTTTTTTYKWYGCVGSRVDNKKLVLNDQSPTVKYPGYVATGQKCLTEILPLTRDQKAVQSAIAGMITSRSGYVPQTYIPAGMMWGINVLSKSEPFSQGADYDPLNEKPRKVIVLMTDGLNTRRVNLTGTLNHDYLKGGALIGDTNTANAAERVQTNTDTVTLCTYAKSNNIEIFTVAFKVEDAAAKTMLETCATDSSHYYDASDSQKLLDAFIGIGASLTQVRLAR